MGALDTECEFARSGALPEFGDASPAVSGHGVHGSADVDAERDTEKIHWRRGTGPVCFFRSRRSGF